MGIAHEFQSLNKRVLELEKLLAELQERIKVLESRRGPGRPPKEENAGYRPTA